MVVDSNGCIAEAAINIVIIRDEVVFVPNVFSPNGDGQNDLVTVFGNIEVEQIIEFSIFDKWGNNVYQKHEFEKGTSGWDGNFKGQPMNPGVFTWHAEILFKGSKSEHFAGTITLLK